MLHAASLELRACLAAVLGAEDEVLAGYRLHAEAAAQRRPRSGSDLLERVLRDAQVAQRVLPTAVRLRIDNEAVAPRGHVGDRHHNLSPALASTPAEHTEGERMVAEVEVGLGLAANVFTPRFLHISKDPANASVAV